MNVIFSLLQKAKKHDGFILPLTLFICTVILAIATSISVLLAKEIYFSHLAWLSQVAYYAADDGLMCATTVDDKFVDPDTGLGIFQHDTLTTSQQVLDKINAARASQGRTVINLNDIKCATASIFDQSVSNLSMSPQTFSVGGTSQSGISTTFDMKMDLGGGDYRCATVTVNKTTSYRQIIARGFATCSVGSSPYLIERAVVGQSVNTYFETLNITQ